MWWYYLFCIINIIFFKLIFSEFVLYKNKYIVVFFLINHFFNFALKNF